jgi:hypothetical protein
MTSPTADSTGPVVGLPPGAAARRRPLASAVAAAGGTLGIAAGVVQATVGRRIPDWMTTGPARDVAAAVRADWMRALASMLGICYVLLGRCRSLAFWRAIRAVDFEFPVVLSRRPVGAGRLGRHRVASAVLTAGPCVEWRVKATRNVLLTVRPPEKARSQSGRAGLTYLVRPR